MFDIGFWEIAVIAVVALVVVGPKEFPSLVRTIGVWLRTARSYVNDFNNAIEREANRVDELKKLVEKEQVIADLHKVVDEESNSIPSEPMSKSEQSPEVPNREKSKD